MSDAAGSNIAAESMTWESSGFSWIDCETLGLAQFCVGGAASRVPKLMLDNRPAAKSDKLNAQFRAETALSP